MQCPDCNARIPGYRHGSFRTPDLPDHCYKCGKAYPWKGKVATSQATPPSAPQTEKKIVPTLLILASSPEDQARLSLNREVKKIKEALKRSKNREDWDIESNEAATVEDLRRALLEHKPAIVHFSGHGGGDAGLCFETDQGGTHLTHADPLAKLFHHFKDTLKCVVLNACYSTVQGEAIRQQIDHVVGMRKAIGDVAATKFAVAFYDAVFAGVDFRLAFDLGCTAIDLSNLPDTEAPVYLTSPQQGGITLEYTDHIPAVETYLHTYLNTPYAERYKFTTKGVRLATAIRKHYGEQLLAPTSHVKVITMGRIDAEYWKVYARVTTATGEWYRPYFVRIRGRDIKVEWEATVGLWSTPVKTYLALGTEDSVTARVTAELGNYYHGIFYGHDDDFQNIELVAEDRVVLQGYVKRNADFYEDLMEIMTDGNAHQITVLLQNVVDDDTRHPVIMGLLSQSWIVPDEPEESEESGSADK
jgi:hypothetical protein